MKGIDLLIIGGILLTVLLAIRSIRNHPSTCTGRCMECMKRQTCRSLNEKYSHK